ncbi:MAG TPA: HlyD family efflux transporter periplasmic adaptor subunit [Phycisphaerales bacterium]|nr:HlyD family efflux transporter periplasmic adaptor subunit [Phycisphaerales bacterium]
MLQATKSGETSARLWWTRGGLALALVCVAGGVVVLAGAGDSAQDSAPARPAPVATPKGLTSDMGVAKRQPFDISTTANGDLQAKNQIELRSKLDRDSTIQFIIPEGTRVKKDELLVQLNNEQVQQQIDEEKPRLEQQRASLVAAENQYQIQMNDNAQALRRAELDKELAMLQLNQWRSGDVVKKRQDLALKIDTADLELSRLADRLVRSEDLYAEGFLSKDERDRDEVSYIQAIASYKQAQLDLATYETYEYIREEREKISDVEQKDAEVIRVRLNNEIQLASRKADRDNQQSQLTLLEQRLKKLQEQFDACAIKAPQDGLVVYSTSVEGMRWGRGGNDSGLQIGSQVYPNQLIIALPDTSEMVATVRVHESMAGRIRPGQKATLRIDAAGGQVFDGTVDSIGVMAESGGWRDPNLREYSVKIALDSKASEANLKPAMRVEARVTLDKVDETLTIPVQALFSEGAVQYVYQPQGKRFVRVPVRVGRRSDTLAEIAAGLPEGSPVLLRQPSAGEVLSQEWSKEQLIAAGYQLNEQGEVIAGRGPGGAGGPGGRGQRPTTVKRDGEQKPKADAAPAADKPPAADAAPASTPENKTAEGDKKDGSGK